MSTNHAKISVLFFFSFKIVRCDAKNGRYYAWILNFYIKCEIGVVESRAHSVNVEPLRQFRGFGFLFKHIDDAKLQAVIWCADRSAYTHQMTE